MSIPIVQNKREQLRIQQIWVWYIVTKVFNIFQRIVWTNLQGWTAITGPWQNELIAYYMAISEKQKDRQNGKSLRVGASQVV